MCEYADKKRKTCPSTFQPGKFVLVKQQQKNKLTPPFSPLPYMITQRKGSMVTSQRGQNNIARNSSHLKNLWKVYHLLALKEKKTKMTRLRLRRGIAIQLTCHLQLKPALILYPHHHKFPPLCLNRRLHHPQLQWLFLDNTPDHNAKDNPLKNLIVQKKNPNLKSLSKIGEDCCAH